MILNGGGKLLVMELLLMLLLAMLLLEQMHLLLQMMLAEIEKLLPFVLLSKLVLRGVHGEGMLLVRALQVRMFLPRAL
jgi:hypothetical protein